MALYRIIELNTQHYPIQNFMDETPRVRCSKCGKIFNLGYGMDQDPTLLAITDKHLELCEGDAAVTLLKLDQLFKTGEWVIP